MICIVKAEGCASDGLDLVVDSLATRVGKFELGSGSSDEKNGVRFSCIVSERQKSLTTEC